MRHVIDLTNKVFGKIKVLQLSPNNIKYKPTKWVCQCECGRVWEVAGTSLTRNSTISCGCIKAERMRKLKTLKPGQASKNTLYRNYKKGALRRNLSFELTFDEFINLTEQNCYYCGIVPSQNSKTLCPHTPNPIKYNGVDRINNSEGYLINNCVPCCNHCNYAKFDFTQEEFISYLIRLIDYRSKLK